MVTTVTDNSPQSINTSLFSLDKEVQEIKKVTDKLSGINPEANVISVNGKQGIVELTASDVKALPSSTVIPTTTSELENTSGFITSSDSITGNAATATTADKVKNTLTVNGKTYDGSSEVDAGVQTVANGGTGVTTQADINKAFIGNLDVGDSDVTDGTEFVSSYASDNGFSDSDGLNTPFRRQFIKVWNYIKGKISSVLGLTKDNYGGKSAKSSFLDEYVGAGGNRPTSGNFVPKDASEYGGMRKDVVTSSMTDSGRPGERDGHLLTMFWDNSGRYDSQLFIRNGAIPELKVRGKDNQTDYGPWVDLITSNNIGSQTVAKASTAGTADYANAPTGFRKSKNDQSLWGNQDGVFITDWETVQNQGVDSGDISFRFNNGQLNIIIDGVFYQNEGKYKLVDENSIKNIMKPNYTTGKLPAGVYKAGQSVSVSASITTTRGNPVFISYSGDYNSVNHGSTVPWISFELFVDGQIVQRTVVDDSVALESDNTPFAGNALVVLSAGSHTIRLDAVLKGDASGQVQFQEQDNLVNLVAFEL